MKKWIPWIALGLAALLRRRRARGASGSRPTPSLGAHRTIAALEIGRAHV